MTAEKEKSRRHFDRWARSYERDPSSRRLAGLQAEALAALELGPSDRLLDVGCGTGAAVRKAAAVAERAAGVDLSPGMVARARELAAGIDNVEFCEADSEELPFEDRSFTAVLCSTSFHHYPNQARAVREMARVLGSGCRAVIADGCTDRPAVRVLDRVLRRVQGCHVGFPSSEQLRELFSGAGLRPEGARTLYRGGYVIARALKP